MSRAVAGFGHFIRSDDHKILMFGMDKSSAFYIFCIPTRFILAASLICIPPAYHRNVAILLALISIAFMVLYTFGLRNFAPESSTGKTWWANFRSVHAMMYGAAAAALYHGHAKSAATFLVLDTIIGIALRHAIVR